MLSVYEQQPLDGLADSGKFWINPGDEPIELQMNDFERIGYIAKGSFGEVYRTKWCNGNLEMAQKISPFKNSRHRQQASFRHETYTVSVEPWYRELSFHTKFSDHENIIRLYGYIAMLRVNRLHFFLELMTCSFKEILQICTPYDGLFTDNITTTPFKREGVTSIKPFRAFLKHVCSGLSYLHGKGYMHRDLKPGNILLKAEDGTRTAVVKIADFGTIKDHQDTTRGENGMLHSADPGTTKYSAPEVVYNDRKYDTPCDLWSVGITALQLLAGYHPVLSDDERGRHSSGKSSDSIYCRSISNDDIFTDLPVKMGLEGELAGILGRCLEREPEERPTAEEVLEVVGDVQDDGNLLYEWFSSELSISETELNDLREQH